MRQVFEVWNWDRGEEEDVDRMWSWPDEVWFRVVPAAGGGCGRGCRESCGGDDSCRRCLDCSALELRLRAAVAWMAFEVCDVSYLSFRSSGRHTRRLWWHLK